MGRGGASHLRRLLLRLAGGWRPPDVRPSGAGLTRGARMPSGARHAVEGAPPPGRRRFPCAWAHLRRGVKGHSVVGPDGDTATSWAVAHRKPATSRAVATATPLAFCRASSGALTPRGRRSPLTAEAWVGLQAELRAGHLARLEEVRRYLKKQWRIAYQRLNGVWWLLKRHRVKLKTGRRRHRRAAATQQAAFKKTSAPG